MTPQFKKLVSGLFLLLFLSTEARSAYALGTKEAAASLLLPVTGQAMNNELGRTKTKVMAGLEIGLIGAVTFLGITTGGGIVWFAAAPLIGNHVWSSVDAFKGARRNQVLKSIVKSGLAKTPEEASRVLRYGAAAGYGTAAAAVGMTAAGEGLDDSNYEPDIRTRISRAAERSEY